MAQDSNVSVMLENTDTKVHRSIDLFMSQKAKTSTVLHKHKMSQKVRIFKTGTRRVLPKWLKITVILLLIQYSYAFKHDETNRTNIIDRRRSVNPSYKDQSIDEITTTCGSCQMRQDIRNRSLETIKEQILLRLGMQHPLNTTGRKLPQVPQDMLAQFPGLQVPGMLGDQPQSPFKPGPSISEEEDTLHIKTESVMTFAKPCKYFNTVLCYVLCC